MSSDDATLADSGGHTEPVVRLSDPGIDQRYILGALLGRGGMGEVRNASDTRINREVAVKLLSAKASTEDTIARFLREARVQGALEHPAVPPVHDLGIDKEGQPYFVMKKLAGTTLGDVLESRSSSDALQQKWPRRLLLTRLVDVCLAIEFAHTRGVVHRDLKPANIMLGDFGETYVLDWGLARITNDDWPTVKAVSGEVEPGHTAAGAMLGTPGYMAPEQIRGEEIDGRADVFALGCILFEILTNVTALPKGLSALDATLQAAEHRPSKRVANVPPELDDLCARATALDRAARPTARQLANGIQAYLDGDRDLENRRALAIVHLDNAMTALDQDGAEARARAMREASSALVLDPTNATARQLVARLVLEPPEELPAAALAAADRERGKSRQKVLQFAAITYLGVAAGVGALFSFPIHHAWPIVTTIAMLAVLAGFYAHLARKPLPMKSPEYTVILILNTLTLIVASFIFGPMLLLPIFLVGSLAGFIITPVSYSPVTVVAAHVFAFLLPVTLELVGATQSTFHVENGTLVFTPYAVELNAQGATILLVAAVLSQFANSTAIGLSERRGQERALDQVSAQSWHLKQLVPGVTDRRRATTGEPSK